MTDTDLIIDALNRMHVAQTEMNDRLSKVLEDHETRLRSAESSLSKFKTFGSGVTALMGFFGWEAMRQHISLFK